MGADFAAWFRLLVDLESGVDTTAGKLQLGMRRMQEFIKANAGMRFDVGKGHRRCRLLILFVKLCRYETTMDHHYPHHNPDHFDHNDHHGLVHRRKLFIFDPFFSVHIQYYPIDKAN